MKGCTYLKAKRDVARNHGVENVQLRVGPIGDLASADNLKSINGGSRRGSDAIRLYDSIHISELTETWDRGVLD